MTAVSMQVMDKERLGTLVSPRAQAFYTRGVVAMRELLHGELTCNYDEVLTGIFMLEIYEILSAIGLESVHSAVHQNAGMRIMKRASTLNIDTRPTAPIAVALQSRYIYACLSAGLPTPLCTRLDDFVAFPGVGGKLDSFAAEVADLLYERRIILNRSPQASSPNTTSFLTPSATPKTPASSTASTDLAPSTAAVLLLRTISLLTRLQSWYASLPPSWHRHRLPPTSNIHSTIRISSIYAGLCDVYTSLPISHSLGMYRVLRIASLQTRHLLETHLSHNQNSSTTPDTYADADVLAGANSQPEVQALVDDLCAAVPFHLGNRGHPLEALVGTLYPPTPDWLRRKARFVDQYGAATEMTDLHHAAEAASRGGFMILMPLLGVLQLFVGGDVEGQLGQEDAEAETGAGGGRRRRVRGNPFKLRDGQLMWMQAQVMRTSQLLLKPSVA
ncbi:uncharacterized protein HMPREF1541_08320 [Cyphellophora europaea CBS 101466]|uniref:Uncharacterized protein n=1 Tax=Cyphellophora europaea (strain CBS 101466) TaxID=1220924 RepID=W2RNM5_CYPE1|nr:uncharacterized protein HMPREF1541_08320 [Cyphellophora europaea CBS 101466]ETN37329.1 hypothetical protein HMPREF1541_08320 [Cyphellophora europaea CBS 101466]